MKLLPLRPAYLHESADLDRRLSNGYFTTQDRRFLQRPGSDHAEASLAHIVNAAGYCTALLPRADVWKRGYGHLKVLGEPGLPAAIAFGKCPHGK
jgi:hypothetical protein